ncbi:MBL fold metallo-hydrolase [Bradyrhizobium sp. Bra64]|uniref:MBL fold metallo-hydrolase n=1 Tax=Bradyrhizobium sp. Bra64 TaxID=2926009 RepID=UPI002117A1FD|nr:MBL fold metallo-hydrolase [Bradyrhizobium sp. Bra64]
MQKVGFGINHVEYAMGELRVVALRDGHVDMPPSRLRQTDGRPFGAELPQQVDLVEGRLRLSVNAFLIIDGYQHTLIDTGASNSWEPTMGLLLSALSEAGVVRGAIDTVALTHTHSDHANGLVAADGADAFPSLRRLFVPREELSMFDGNERLARFRSRRLPLDDGCKLSDCITSMQAHGHEVGHTGFEVLSNGETLLVWGDTVHVPSIQFARPELSWEFDADQNEARATRQKLLHRAAQANVAVAGAHLDFPGIGMVSGGGGTFHFRSL